MTFVPIPSQQRIRSATALLVALSKATGLPEVRDASRRAASQLLRLEPETMADRIVPILMDLFDLQGYARMRDRAACADAIEGIRILVRDVYNDMKRESGRL